MREKGGRAYVTHTVHAFRANSMHPDLSVLGYVCGLCYYVSVCCVRSQIQKIFIIPYGFIHIAGRHTSQQRNMTSK